MQALGGQCGFITVCNLYGLLSPALRRHVYLNRTLVRYKKIKTICCDFTTQRLGNSTARLDVWLLKDLGENRQ